MADEHTRRPKLEAAIDLAIEEGLEPEDVNLYAKLERLGYMWDGKSWVKAHSTNFERSDTDDGLAF